jgi:NlpC/P60 family putative phage cell wall peptidase
MRAGPRIGRYHSGFPLTEIPRSTIGAEAVRLARGWLGTPYRHQACLKGAGCDCLGLVRGVFAELYGQAAETPPPYSRDWAEATGRETMIEAAARHLIPIAPAEAAPGDVLIFRLRPGAMAKHAAIMTTEARMIHAMEGAPVCEIHITSWWRRRIAAVFRFPDQET